MKYGMNSPIQYRDWIMSQPMEGKRQLSKGGVVAPTTGGVSTLFENNNCRQVTNGSSKKEIEES